MTPRARRDGAPRDGAPRDGAPRDGAPRDGASDPREGAEARLDALLLGARPSALRGRAGDASAVRVLARVAALEGTERARAPRPARRPRAAARRRTGRVSALVAGAAVVLVAGAAVVLVAGIVLGRAGPSGEPTPGSVAREVADPAPRPIADATGPRVPRVVAAVPRPPVGPTPAEVRDRWLTIAEGHAPDAGDALRALARVGGPCGPDEARRVAALHRDAVLAPVVREVLVEAPGDVGPQALATALIGAHAVAVGGDAASARERDAQVPALVGALERVARTGRATLALDGLRRAADAGCAAAAVGCLRVSGAPELDRALALLKACPETLPALVEAVALRPRVLGAALLRRVERGDREALTVAAAACVDGLAATVRPFLGDPVRAGAVVEALARRDDAASVETLALALGGPAEGPARRALEALGARAVATLTAAAVAAGGDASADPFLAALAGLGDAAVPSLVALADRPTLAVRVVRALSSSSAAGACDALAGLADRASLTRVVVDALTVRRAAGDPKAASALAATSRPPTALAAGGAGPGGVPVAPRAPERRSGDDPVPVAPATPAAGPTGAGTTDGPGLASPLRPPSRPAAGGPSLPPVAPPRLEPPGPLAPPAAPAPRPPTPPVGGRSKSI